MPSRNTKLRFVNYHKQLPIPFVVYADFECFTKPMGTCSPNPEDSYTYSYQKHEPSRFCLYLKGLDGINKLFKPITYTKKSEDDDVAVIFVSKLEKLTQKIYNDFYRKPIPMKLDMTRQQEYYSANKCHICGGELNHDRVRDQCHLTGVYRGAAHNRCNLQCRKPMILPVIFHNLRGYDAHLFIKQLARLSGGLSCIPSTEKKYISFSKKIKVGEYKSRRNGETISLNFEIRFIDSFKFLQTSLANLVGNLQPDDCHNTKAIIKDSERSEGVVYVLLLADVFEPFRKTCLRHYNLDPAHYYTSPGLAWDACLKTTGQELQLLHDYDMLMMFERGIRGGITHISRRYV